MDVTNKSCSFDLFTLENNSGQVDDGALNMTSYFLFIILCLFYLIQLNLVLFSPIVPRDINPVLY